MPKKGVKIDPYANGAEKSYFSKQVFPKFIQAKYLQCQKYTVKKVEFCQTFTIQAPLEIQVAIE